jgi:hypothetical protein
MPQLPADLVHAVGKAQNGIAKSASASVALLLPADLAELDVPVAGGIIRDVTIGLMNSFGDLASVTALDYYQQLVDAGIGSSTARALAKRQLDPVYRDWLEKLNKSKPVRVEKAVGRSMAKFSQGKTLEAQVDLSATLGREVTNMFRETMATFAEADPNVSGYQRVASATACAFCAVVALNQYTSFQDDDGYHDHCGCSTIPIFRGESSFRPDYYDSFQSEYDSAFASVNSSKAEDILAAMRLQSGRA